LGEIKSISNGALVLVTDDGKTVNVSLADGVKVVRIPPGATDLKNAIPITVEDLQVGDRVLARGAATDSEKSFTASSVIVMKQSDVAAKQQQEREDWQKRGIGGLVSAVDPTAGTVKISPRASNAARTPVGESAALRIMLATFLNCGRAQGRSPATSMFSLCSFPDAASTRYM